MPEEKSKEKTSDDILATAKERFKLAAEAENDIRRDALEDIEFSAGKQWPDTVRAERESDSRPCIVINRIPQFIRQITNDQRQNRPAIKVHPVDDVADPETAKVIQGLIRHIEYNSNADVAYDTAFDGAARGGFGWWRVVTDYSDPLSFDQDIFIKRIRNQFTVYGDPCSQEPDGSDMNWAFIVEDLLEEDFEAQFPNSKMTGMDDLKSVGDHEPDWMPGAGKVRIAEYFYKELREVKIAQMSDGSVLKEEELPSSLPEGITVVQTRFTMMPVVKWCKINGIEILEEREWPGKWIPLVPVYGEELIVDGKRILESVIRHAKDSQRMYNYWASSETETIALAPRTPWVGVEGQFEGFEGQWMTANRKNHAFLQYKPVSLNGTPVGPPQRQVFEAPVQAITQARMQAAEDLKATTGIYDAALGNKSNESSGVAIQRRNMQTQTSNFHFIDNLRRSQRHTGRILVDLIPKIYDTPRAIRIIGEGDDQEVVTINKIFQDGNKVKMHDMTIGKYDVVMDNGPSFATKREEAVQSMLEFIKIYPQGAQVVSDLLVKNMDWPEAQEISDRLKKLLPPGTIEDKNQPQLPPQIKQQMDQSQKMIDALTKQLNTAHDAMDTKTLELESRERIEMAKIKTQLELAMFNQGSVEAIALLKSELGSIQNRMSMLDYNEPIDADQDADQQQQGGQAPQNPQNSNLGSAGPNGALPPENQPTGGPSPGNPMEQRP